MVMLNQETELEKFNDSILSESILLYIEDNKEEQATALDAFKTVFKDVMVASDGVEALELYKQNQNQINIILTDMDMPNMDGKTLMQEIRNLDWSIPILAITEDDNLSNIIPKVIKLKVANYLIKPLQCITALKIFQTILDEINNLKLLEKQKQELIQYRDILDGQALVSETDLTGTITFANDLFCEVSGYERDELIGQPHNIVRHPDVSPQIYADLWKTIQDGKVWNGKIKNRSKDGSDYHVKATVFPVFNSNGEIVKYMSSRYLITDEEHEKQKLKKYIMSQRTEKIKSDQNYNEKVKHDVETAMAKGNLVNLQKMEQMSKTVKEVQEELHRLRTLKEHASRKVISLEKEAREATTRSEKIQDAYKEKVDKLLATTKTAYEQYEVVKKKNDGFESKFGKTQVNIKKMEKAIETYRKKIKNLDDVIRSLEADIKLFKEEAKKKKD